MWGEAWALPKRWLVELSDTVTTLKGVQIPTSIELIAQTFRYNKIKGEGEEKKHFVQCEGEPSSVLQKVYKYNVHHDQPKQYSSSHTTAMSKTGHQDDK